MMTVFIVANRRVGTDKPELIHTCFHVDSGASIAGESEHIVEHPQRGRQCITYPGPPAAGERVHLADAIGNTAAQGSRSQLLELELKLRIDPQQLLDRAAGVLPFPVVMMGEENGILPLIGCETGYPIGFSGNIRTSQWDTWKLLPKS